MHWLQSAFVGGDCPYAAEWQTNRDGAGTGADEFEWQLSTLGLDGNCPGSVCHEWWAPAPLNRNQTYRVEERYFRRVSAGWKCQIRIYTSDNVLLYDSDDIVCSTAPHAGDWHAAHTLQQHFDGSSGINGDLVTTADCLRHFMVGQPNHPGGGSVDPAHDCIWVGGFAVSHTDWCGAYTQGEGP
jgi:hypothetical protein